MKKVLQIIVAGIAFVSFVAFFIWASVEDKEWLIIVFLAFVFTVFLAFVFIIAKIDDKKRQKREQRPPDFTDEKLGEFWYDSFGKLSKDIKWCDDEITLCIDSGNEEETKDSIKYALLHFQNPVKSDKSIRDHAANELLSLANDWNDDSIDRDEFISRISLVQINVNYKGDYEFWLDSDGIFTDHSIMICGNAVSGFDRTDIEG